MRNPMGKGGIGVGGCGFGRISRTIDENYGVRSPDQKRDIVLEALRGAFCPLTTSQVADKVQSQGYFMPIFMVGTILKTLVASGTVERLTSRPPHVWSLSKHKN